MAIDYARMKTEDLHALYKKSCAEFKSLSEEITSMRTVLESRRQIAEYQAAVKAAEERIAEVINQQKGKA